MARSTRRQKAGVAGVKLHPAHRVVDDIQSQIIQHRHASGRLTAFKRAQHRALTKVDFDDDITEMADDFLFLAELFAELLIRHTADEQGKFLGVDEQRLRRRQFVATGTVFQWRRIK